MRLWTLFISYSFGGHYCGVYPSLEYVRQVIKEMAEDMELTDELPTLRRIKSSIEKKDDFWHEFLDSTWIHVQEVSEQLVEQIKRAI